MLQSLLFLTLLLQFITKQMVYGVDVIISQLMHRLRHQIGCQSGNLQHVVDHFRVQVPRVGLRQSIIQFCQIDEIIAREPFVSRDLLQRVSPLGLDHQHVPNEVLALLRHEERNSKFAADDDASEIVEGCAIKRQRSAYQHVKDDAQTPDVSTRAIVLEALEDFRRGVRWTTAECFEISALRESVAEAEIGELKNTSKC